jgi:hypothetical protein
MNESGFNLEVAYDATEDVNELLSTDFIGSYKEIDINIWLFEDVNDLVEAVDTLLSSGVILEKDIISADVEF